MTTILRSRSRSFVDAGVGGAAIGTYHFHCFKNHQSGPIAIFAPRVHSSDARNCSDPVFGTQGYFGSNVQGYRNLEMPMQDGG